MNKQYFDYIRMQQNISLEKLSELTQIPISTLTKISCKQIQTSFENMCKIAKALKCSLDDLADEDCSDYSQTHQEHLFMKRFHSLSTQKQHMIHMIFEMEEHLVNVTNGNTCNILCFIPISFNNDCFFQHCFVSANLSCPIVFQYPTIDFALKIPNCYYHPYFFESDILLFKHSLPNAEEIALFQQNERIFLRRYTIIENVPMLQSIHLDNPSSEPWINEKCRCLGTLHSVIRANSPLSKRIRITY